MHAGQGLQAIFMVKIGHFGVWGPTLAFLAVLKQALTRTIYTEHSHRPFTEIIHSDPLVDAIVPNERGSSSSAIRSARANALNTVSH